MNCPQCRTPNQQDAAFCANCGTPLAAAQAPASSSGYMPAPGQGTPVGYGAPGGSDPTGYGAPSGYGSSGPAAPTSQYPSAGQYPPAGYPQQGGQYQPQQPRPGTVGAPFQFDMNRLTRVDRIVGIASLIAMISIWLPWYSFAGLGTLSGTWHGWLWLEFVVALALIAYLGLRAGSASEVRLPIAHAPLLIVATGLQLLLILIAFALVPGGDEGVGWTWGAFVGLLAALVAAGPVIWPAAQSYLQSRQR